MADVRAVPGREGLRDRKKARTRALIREHALRLFAEQGFQATTVEQIAAAADVSPATFFRYFPTKDDVVTGDGIDVLVIESLLRQPPRLDPVAATRSAMASVLAALPAAELARFSSSARLGMSMHETGEFARTARALAAALAQRAGREHDNFSDRILAGAILGAIMAAGLTGPGTPGADLPARFDAALACLEAGQSRPAD